MSTLARFKATIASFDFQAQGTVTGTITAATIVGSRSGSVTGTFAVKGSDSAVSISAKILGITSTNDNIVVGGWSYSRANGGDWTKAPASGKTLQAFVGSGIVLSDYGLESKFGRWLHRFNVADVAGVDLSAFGISAGAGQDNLALTSLSFWAERDGTPAGLSLGVAFDQKILGTASHETVALDIGIDTLSGVTISPPSS
jgi:hypothetical protein